MVAKDDVTHRGLARQLEARTVQRRYQVLVWGRIDGDVGRIEAHVGRHPKDRRRMAVRNSGGRYAATRFEIEQVRDFLTFLSAFLETGRTHQIRVHMNHIGHPVFCDAEYGGSELKIRGIASQFRAHAGALLKTAGRQMLHAANLGFLHPVTGEEMQFYAAPPDDMTEVLRSLAVTPRS